MRHDPFSPGSALRLVSRKTHAEAILGAFCRKPNHRFVAEKSPSVHTTGQARDRPGRSKMR